VVTGMVRAVVSAANQSQNLPGKISRGGLRHSKIVYNSSLPVLSPQAKHRLHKVASLYAAPRETI
jgi:hypothetical protein